MGVAIFDTEEKAMALFTGELQAAIDWIAGKDIIHDAVVVLENPDLNPHFFAGSGAIKAIVAKYINMAPQHRYGMIGEIEQQFRISARMAQNVGENKAAAKFLLRTFERAKVPVIQINPTERHCADIITKRKLSDESVRSLTMPTKTTTAQFTILTGYAGRSSEHSRDAATLVWGKPQQWVVNRLMAKPSTQKKQKSFAGKS